MDRPVPSDPEVFFRDFLPSVLAGAGRPFGDLTSVGSVTFRVVPNGEWSLRLRDGELEVVRDLEDDVVIQVTTSAADFQALLAELASAGEGSPRRGALGVLAADAQTCRMVRHVPGSLLFVLKDGGERRRVLFSPGRRAANLDSAECTIECSLDDLRELGKSGGSPLALFAAGKLRVSGNVQIAMALSAVLG